MFINFCSHNHPFAPLLRDAFVYWVICYYSFALPLFICLFVCLSPTFYCFCWVEDLAMTLFLVDKVFRWQHECFPTSTLSEISKMTKNLYISSVKFQCVFYYLCSSLLGDLIKFCTLFFSKMFLFYCFVRVFPDFTFYVIYFCRFCVCYVFFINTFSLW